MSYSFLNKYIKAYGKLFGVAVLFLTFEAICDLLQPTIMAKIIDQGVAGKQMDVVWNLGGLMLLITGLGAASAFVRNLLSSHVSQKFGAELRADLFRKTQELSLDNVNSFDRASLVTRITNDVTQVQMFVNGMMRVFVKAPLLCIGSLIMAARLNAELAVILAVVVPIVGGIIVMNMKLGFPLFVNVQNSLDRVNGVSREYLSGVRVVKAFNRFSFEMDKFKAANEDLRYRSTSAMRIMALFTPGVALIVNFGIVAVLWFGGLGVQEGQMQAGQIIAFINYMTQILFSLLLIAMVFNMFVRAKASAERIGQVFLQKNMMTWQDRSHSHVNTGRNENEKGRIEFDQVSFSYHGPNEEPVIKDVTFACGPGDTLGIIGSTGSGKSTLVHLIPRFYDADKGSIRIDGENVRDMDPKKLREKIAIVPQKTILFTGTVRENIQWGKENAEPHEIEQSARMAEAHGFIASSPEGYETKIGQGGVNFSGGQKQRLAIARALVRNSEILILDDCTSALDAATEGRIKESLKKYAEGVTCLMIAQRISSVMDADQILVLDDGKIVGKGIHQELLRDCAVYQEIFRSQMGKEKLPNVTAK